MSSIYNSAAKSCQGKLCQATARLTYNVKEKKELCDDCASTASCIRKTSMSELNLFCDSHDKEIKLYCRQHDAGVCQLCALMDHKQESCKLDDIDKAIAQKKQSLSSLRHDAADKKAELRRFSNDISQCRGHTEEHLTKLKIEINGIIDKEIMKEKEGGDKTAADINWKADQQIRKINEKREEELKETHDDAAKRRASIEGTRRALLADLQDIANKTAKKVGEMEKLPRDAMQIIEDETRKIDALFEDDRDLIICARRLITSLADAIQKPIIDERVVGHVTRTVLALRFVKGVGDEEYNGRIDGYEGSWSSIDLKDIAHDIKYPHIIGYFGSSHVFLSSQVSNVDNTYALNFRDEKGVTEKMISGRNDSYVVTCVMLNQDMIVCGKTIKACTGNVLTGCVGLYDRQGKLIRDVNLPRNTTSNDSRMDVAVDRDGMIVAAEAGQSMIHVIKSADGTIVRSIDCHQNIVMHGVLSSGHIVTQPCPADSRLLIIDREGRQREIIHGAKIWNCDIDPLTDDLYIVTLDGELKTCIIELICLSAGRARKHSKIASFPLSTKLTKLGWLCGHLFSSRVVMTPSGKLVASDGESIVVLKKEFQL